MSSDAKNQMHAVETFSEKSVFELNSNVKCDCNVTKNGLLPGAGLAEPAVLHGGGRADAGRGAAGGAQVALVQQLQQLLLRRAACI